MQIQWRYNLSRRWDCPALALPSPSSQLLSTKSFRRQSSAWFSLGRRVKWVSSLYLYCQAMTRKEPSLPFRSQIWFCSLSNKLKKKKEERKSPCELRTHYHFPWISRSLWNPTRAASQCQTAEWNCTGKKRSLAGVWSRTPEQQQRVVCVRLVLRTRGAVPPHLVCLPPPAPQLGSVR